MPKPTKPTVPPAALRSNPETFSANAEGTLTFLPTLTEYMDDGMDFVSEEADRATAAALAAGAADGLDLAGQAGKYLRVNSGETGTEFVSLPTTNSIEGLANGLVTKTASGVATARQIAAGTGISVADGDGVDGNPTVSAVTRTQTQWRDKSDTTEAALSPAKLAGVLNASGEAPIYACRAWVNFNGTGTPAIRASGNVSSITDNGVGDYTINFSTALPDANYAVGGAGHQPNSTVGISAMLAASLRIEFWDTGNDKRDGSTITLAVFR